MRTHLLIIILLFFFIHIEGQSQWKFVAEKIMTPWAQQVSPDSVLPEYPRPQLERDTWLNLNGLWSYSVSPSSEAKPATYSGQILVPFAIESALSGVAKRVGKENRLWYRRTISLPRSFRGKNVLLHFGAVDWRCEVFVNGNSVGTHEGGYDPFTFDVTNYLKKKGNDEIVVSVWDPSDDGPQPRGKQVKDPNSIWYTPVTGIWQTVWMEPVNPTHLRSLRIRPDVDRKLVRIVPQVENSKSGDQIKITILDNNQKIAEVTKEVSATSIPIPNPTLWSTESPKLYDLEVSLIRGGKSVDKVRSYFAMRKISLVKENDGIHRMYLNDKFVFQYGPLDQGWWPDGLYTAPTDEALKFDIEKTKEMGFNMIRKHVKVEPQRWYYHCDRVGVLVWQDMPSGDMGNRWDSRPGIVGVATDKDRSPESEAIFKKEWKAIMDATYNHPSIVVWVPFNEAWGQFKTEEIVTWTMSYDSSRLVNAASGGNFTNSGHIIDLHNYPLPAMPDPALFGKTQSIVLGEYGGLGLPVEGHTWQTKDNWGYQTFSTAEELASKYASFIGALQSLITKGLSAAVYTQTTDVEIETNGLMTYDRKVIKIPVEKLNSLHRPLYNTNLSR